tara:strand:- start:9511 stop:9636 length:126 start_codon:yes stop_codon:yes gene_type:complete
MNEKLAKAKQALLDKVFEGPLKMSLQTQTSPGLKLKMLKMS